jgi:hypothetical protein
MVLMQRDTFTVHFPYSATRLFLFGCDVMSICFCCFEHEYEITRLKGCEMKEGGMSCVDVLLEAACSCRLVAFSGLYICRVEGGGSE